MRSLEWGESDLSEVEIEFTVFVAHESITKDPQGACWWGNVQPHEPRDALGDSALCYLNNVILRGEHVGCSIKNEVDIWHLGDLSADNQVLSLHEWDGTDSFVDGFHIGRGSCDEGGTTVHDSLTPTNTCLQDVGTSL